MKQPVGRFDTESGLWELTRQWVCDLGAAGVLTILPGFRSDGASIPRVLWPYVGPRLAARTFPAALAHDALYASHLVTRATADRVFWRLLRIMGVGPVKAGAYWLAVRIGGWLAWRAKTPSSIAVARCVVSLSAD